MRKFEIAIVVLLVASIALSSFSILYMTMLNSNQNDAISNLSQNLGAISDQIGIITQKPARSFSVSVMPQGADALLWAVAKDMGFMKKYGLENNTHTVFAENDLQAFAYGAVDIGGFSALELAGLINQGWDIVIFGNAQVSGNRIYVLANSSFQTVPDLVGHKFGQYGWGTSGVQAFQLMAKLKWNIDITTAFDNVVASSALMQNLLDTGQVDAITQFTTRAISLQAGMNQTYRSIFGPYTTEWEQMYGVPLPQSLYSTSRKLYEDYPEYFVNFTKCTTETQLYIRDHITDVLTTYADAFLGVSKENALVIQADLRDNYNPVWNQQMIDSQWTLLETAASLQVSIDHVPTAGKDQVFYIPGS